MSKSNTVYRFRFNMSQDGTKRIQPKRQTLDDAYSPPGIGRNIVLLYYCTTTQFNNPSQLPGTNR